MPDTPDVKSLVLDYLKAFDARDLPKCLSYCNEQATFHFLWRTFRGLKGIETWHRDRFAADLRVTRVDNISVAGNIVDVDVIVTSNKLKARKLSQMGARITLRLDRGELTDVKFSHRKPDKSGQGELTDESLYRYYVGPADEYDVSAAMQFSLLTFLGLRDEHYLLDIGCGSLRAGRLLIPYLRPGRYFGLEPEKWLVEEGIKREVGQDQVRIKQPTFRNDSDFKLRAFDRKFDFLLAQSVFTSTPQKLLRKCLSEARKVMNPSALFAATYFEGEENYSGREWIYPGRANYRREFITEAAAQEGLVCLHLDWLHPHGQKWVVFVARGMESMVPDLTGIGAYLSYQVKNPWDI